MNKIIQEKVRNRVKNMMEKGTIPWYKPWSSLKNVGTNYFTKKKYRGLNRILLAESQYATFLQIKEHGGIINKGAVGTSIFCPVVSLIKTKNRSENSNDFLNEDDETIETTSHRIHYKIATVFDIADTNLKLELVEEFDPIASLTEEEALIKVLKLANAKGMTIIEKESNRAFYSPSTDVVVVPKRTQFKTLNEFLGTLLHEIGHATGHKSRLSRKQMTGNFDEENSISKYAKEELVAEIFSLSALAEFGINCPKSEEQTASYLASWKQFCESNIDQFMNACTLSDKALDYFFN